MIRENIKDLILAIAEGDSVAIEDNFNTVMSAKIADRLDDLRVNVASSMFGSTAVEESYELDDYSLEEIEEFMMSEEFEQLDELSKKTLGSYVKQASDSAAALATTAMHQRHQSDAHYANGDKKKAAEFGKYSFDSTERQIKRQKGIKKAVNKLTKEEVESLDEISKSTKLSYVIKATTGKRRPQDYEKQASKDAERVRDEPDNQVWKDRHAHWKNKAAKRTAGIEKATTALTKEEVELDEAREEHDDMNTSSSPKGSVKGSSLHSMDIAKRSGYTHAVMHDGTKGGVDTYHTTKASAEKRLSVIRNKHGIPEYSNRARIAEL